MKNIVLGVTGCIAAYKACEIVRLFKKAGANVDVILTRNAERFVSGLTFENLSGNSAALDTFERPKNREIEHISLAKKADVFLIAPATANIIGKLASGIADDMLTTTALAVNQAKKVICPAMNTAMYENAVVRGNLDRLKELGWTVIEPVVGLLACGDTGQGALADVSEIIATVNKLLNFKNDYLGKRVLITAGATRENIDGIRFISNRSSGKMGLALGKAALARGASVTLVTGVLKEPFPAGLNVKRIAVESTSEMYDAVMEQVSTCDIIIKAAAPADYKPKSVSQSKIKTETMALEFIKNPDIAAAVGAIKREGQRLIVFNAETEDLMQNARKKLKAKNADMIVANDVTKQGAGFDVDTNIVTILSKDGERYDSAMLGKDQIADIILDKILELKG